MDSELKLFKTVIFALLSALCVILFFAYKVEACMDKPENCKEEFKPIDQYPTVECSSGAIIEVVQQPKPGIMCRCPQKYVDAGF